MTVSPQRLLGRRALVTGASRGIGRAVALRFAREGAIVAINHFQDADAAESTLAELHSETPGKREHFTVDADVASPAGVSRMIDETLSRLGRFDILVNNAGIQAPTPGDSFDECVFDRILQVNLVGSARCARAALAHFLSRPGGGAIINTTSVHERIPKPEYLAYSIAKGGLGSLTRTLALEFADRGIRINAVGPGAVVTEMNASWIRDPGARAAVERHIPMGRAASVEEIAPIFAFLASDEASYITGQTIFACGGLTLYGDFQRNWAT